MGVLDADEVVDLLLTLGHDSCPTPKAKEAARIFKELGYLRLAVEQAAP